MSDDEENPTAVESFASIDTNSPGGAFAPSRSLPRSACGFARITSGVPMSMGRVWIRCVSAAGLPLMTHGIFGGASNPYAVVYLSDAHRKQKSPLRRTRCINGTLNPKWREDFCFAVKQKSMTLSLHIEVWHSTSEGPDEFLGHAVLNLNESLFSMAPSHRDRRELPLKPHEKHGGHNRVKGSVKVEIGFDHNLLHGSKVGLNSPSICTELMKSPQALRVFRVFLLGCATLLLMVAARGRWLCRGPSLHDCFPEPVQGTGTCVMLASCAATAVTSVHFAGAIGAFGVDWTGEVLRVQDLLQSARVDEEDVDYDDTNARLQVQSVGYLQWNISMAISLVPRVPCICVRLFTMLAYLIAILLSLLAITLSRLEEGHAQVLGESVYLDALALGCMITSSVLSVRERRLLVKEEGDMWMDVGQERSPKKGNRDVGHGLFSGAIGGSTYNGPNNKIEAWARGHLERFRREADTLAQPLLDARSRIEAQFTDEVRAKWQNLHQSFDGLLGNAGASQTGADGRDWRIPSSPQMPEHCPDVVPLRSLDYFENDSCDVGFTSPEGRNEGIRSSAARSSILEFQDSPTPVERAQPNTLLCCSF